MIFSLFNCYKTFRFLVSQLLLIVLIYVSLGSGVKNNVYMESWQVLACRVANTVIEVDVLMFKNFSQFLRLRPRLYLLTKLTRQTTPQGQLTVIFVASFFFL